MRGEKVTRALRVKMRIVNILRTAHIKMRIAHVTMPIWSIRAVWVVDATLVN